MMHHKSDSFDKMLKTDHESIVKETRKTRTQANCFINQIEAIKRQNKKLKQQLELMTLDNRHLERLIEGMKKQKEELTNKLQQDERTLNERKNSLEKNKQQFENWLKNNSTSEFVKKLKTTLVAYKSQSDEANELGLRINASIGDLFKAQGLPEEKEEKLNSPMPVSYEIGNDDQKFEPEQKNGPFY